MAGCPAAAPRWSAVAPAAARRCSRWSSWSTARRARRARRLHRRSRRPPRSSPRTSPRWASTSTRCRPRKLLAIDHVHVDRARDRGDRRLRPRGAVRPPRACDRFDRRQARRPRHARGAVRRLHQRRPILRAELRRLFRWLKDRGVTAVITAERGDGTLTRHGLEEYVSDCVIAARPPGHRPDLHAAPAHRQVPRLGARHQRVPLPHRRARASRSCRSPASAWTTRCRPSASRPASPASTTCSAARATTAARSVLLSGTAGTGKSSLGGDVRRRRCRRGETRCTSRSKSRRRRSSATCGRSASTSSAWLDKKLLELHAARPSCTASRCTWWRCTARSSASSPRPWCSTPSPASPPSAAPTRSSRCWCG